VYSTLNNLDSSRTGLEDNTNDLNNITSNLIQLVKKANQSHNVKNGIYNPPRSDFLELSHQIEKKIRWCMRKLKELDEITNRSSLFSNDDHIINDIIMNVKTNLNQVQSDMVSLIQNNDLQYSKDSESLSKNITENLNMRILGLTKLFQSALQKRSKTMRKYEEKKNALNPMSNKTKPVVRKGKKGEALFLQEDDIEKKGQGNDNFVLVQEHELEAEYLKSRSDSIKNIEKMLNEVAGIFQRISTLIQMQEVMIDRIDKHTEDTLVNVEKANKHLRNIYSDISSNRKMIFTVFFMLLIFSVMYIVVFM